MAGTASRTLWKGAISFGLVHIPVGLHTATRESGVDFDWLDKRTMDPVGYKRINKRTGREIDRENIVKGVEYENGQYVIISPDEIEEAYPRTTQTIEILRFVEAGAVPFVYLERPYYVAPINKGQKVYALLRDTLAKSEKIAIAKVVIQTKQHLAALIPAGDGLVLNLMRWGDEIKPMEELDLPKAGAKNMSPSAAELKMARMLVDDMSGKWDPDEFKDEFREAIMGLVEKRAKAGQTEQVFEPEEDAPAHGDNVIDLTALLRQSLKGGKGGGAKAGGTSQSRKAASEDSAEDEEAKAPARKTATKAKAAPKKAGETAAAARKTPAKAAKKTAKKRSAKTASAGTSRKAA
ncbi:MULTISPECIES: Ku protein [unclassified Achromobacter]|uniref:non-homologous end joining protein Ku n=1 Tax=unclassified Achromobacter TaxID=2626865 RepID=UPI000B51BB11|nr:MULTISPECIES: Ku protein [unclassified Achromobacter]OWT80461.1 Ku protein [Achromobacter sp. HZ34]OWT82344.1 Ku protein [Achromobacter sp. HZ28]